MADTSIASLADVSGIFRLFFLIVFVSSLSLVSMGESEITWCKMLNVIVGDESSGAANENYLIGDIISQYLSYRMWLALLFTCGPHSADTYTPYAAMP